MEELNKKVDTLMARMMERFDKVDAEAKSLKEDVGVLRQDIDSIRRWTITNQNDDILKKLDALTSQTA